MAHRSSPSPCPPGYHGGMARDSISAIIARSSYVGATVLVAAITAACCWGAWTADEWAMRSNFRTGATLSALVVYRRILWLFSDEARRRPAPHCPPDTP